MFREINNHRRTASISSTGLVTVMCDDGWEDIVDYRVECATSAEAEAMLLGRGFERFDANAELRAMGLKWNGYCYA